MRVLTLGGSGNISASLVDQLVNEGEHEVNIFNRGKCVSGVTGTTIIVGDRYDYAAFESQSKNSWALNAQSLV